MNPTLSVTPRDALVVVDMQFDFVSGSLAIPDAESIIPVVNRLIRLFNQVVVTQDWHPLAHISFASAHHGAKHGDIVQTTYGSQKVFNDHCVQGTRGAELDSRLEWTRAQLVLRKGYRPDIDSFSAFYENDQVTPTGLSAYLRQRGTERIFCVGLAFFGCVKATAESASRDGFKTYLVEDATKGRVVSADENERARSELRGAGVEVIVSGELNA